MSLVEPQTAAEVFANRAAVRARLRSAPGVRDQAIDLRRGKVGGRKGSDPEYHPPKATKPEKSDGPDLRPVWIYAPELAFVFADESPRAAVTTIKEIQRAVVGYFQVTMTDLISHRRHASIVRPRQIACYLAKIGTMRSLPEIAVKFGGRDHTTVLSSIRKIQGMLDSSNPEAVKQVSDLRMMLRI